MFFLAFSKVRAQNIKNYWKPTNNIIAKKKANSKIPTKYKSFILDYKSLLKEINNISSARANNITNKVVLFPNTEGIIEGYTIKEASVMTEALQTKYSNIRSYIGVNTNNPSEIIRFSTDSYSIEIMFLNSNKTYYLKPETVKSDRYMLYSRDSLPKDSYFECMVKQSVKYNFYNTQKREALTNSRLHMFRIALACTGEFSNYFVNKHGANNKTDVEKKLVIMSQYNSFLTQINGVYERDFSVRLLLIENTDELIYFDSNTDPYTNDDIFEMLDENQVNCDKIIGSSNYDVGHVLRKGGGGLAYLNSVCSSSLKASGCSSLNLDANDVLYIEVATHELGHQFGANHTFNNECGGNVSGTTSVEPGSGSTFMSYPGRCEPNVQNYFDTYFNNISVREITYNLRNIFNCGTSLDNNNSAPTITDLNRTYYIPTSTPFSLDAIVNDADGNQSLTYCWEQTDAEAANMPPLRNSSVGPMFRSLTPSRQSNRYFPDMNTILAGRTSNTWEVLPSVARSMNFALTVRDNDIRGGQISFDETEVITVKTNSSFEITSQNSNDEIWYAGNMANITWNVASSNTAPINCEFVDIYMSDERENGFNILVESDVPNTGQYIVSVPEGIDSENARIMIKGQDNVFFAVNRTDFKIVPEFDFLSSFEQSTKIICDSNTASFDFVYNTYNNFSEEVTFSADDLPNGLTATFTPAKASENNTNVNVVISGFDNLAKDLYWFNINTRSNMINKLSPLSVKSYSSHIDDVNILNDNISETEILLPYLLNWESDDITVDYYLQISESDSFDSFVINDKNTLEQYNISNFDILETNKVYYWRIKAENYCNTIYSETYDFNLAGKEVLTYSKASNNNIPDNSTSGIKSTIRIKELVNITDVNITIDLNHTYIGDLNIKLTSPKGGTILLKDYAENDGNNLVSTTFDDSGIRFKDGLSPYIGSFRPVEELSKFNSTRSDGIWTLTIIDGYQGNVGTLLDWSLNIEGQTLLDFDSDGVADIEDKTLQSVAVGGFSPNNDGINDLWIVQGINDGKGGKAIYPKVNITIHNRQGLLVYSQNDYDNSWDGTYKGKVVPAGNYHVSIQSSSDKTSNVKAWIYINY